MAFSDDPFVTIKLAFDPVLRRKALQWEMAGYSKALASLNVRMRAVGNEHGLPHKVLMRTHYSLPRRCLFVAQRYAPFLWRKPAEELVGVGSSAGHQGALPSKLNREGVPGVAL
jgi:hypothetical protein